MWFRIFSILWRLNCGKTPFINSQMTTVILHAVWRAVSLKGLSSILIFCCWKDWRLKKNSHHWTYITNNIVLKGEMTENWFLCTYMYKRTFVTDDWKTIFPFVNKIFFNNYYKSIIKNMIIITITIQQLQKKLLCKTKPKYFEITHSFSSNTY